MRGVIILNKEFILNMIEDLSNTMGAPGFEDDVIFKLKRYSQDLGETYEDTLNNFYLFPKNYADDKIRIMLDGHSDEVGFMVHAITPEGMLKIVPLGGWLVYNIPAHKVKVRTMDNEYITGIVATKPIHYMTDEERNKPLKDISELSVDIGASSKEEVINDYKINIGAPILPDVKFEYWENKDIMVGKAFDNRLGCAAVLAVIQELEKENLNVDIVGAIASQEEVGLRGSVVTARSVKPDICIVFEGSPADDTHSEEYMIQTGLFRGPSLRHLDRAMITNPTLQRFALNVADKFNIKHQQGVRTGGGTNGGMIHTSNYGIPTIVLGIPVRYVHSHYGMATYEDFENTVKLGVEIIKEFSKEYN